MKKLYAVVVSSIGLDGFAETNISSVHSTVVNARKIMRSLLPTDRKWTEKVSVDEYVTREGAAFMAQRGYKRYQVIQLPLKSA